MSRQYRHALESQGTEVFIYARGDLDPHLTDDWRDDHTHLATPCRIKRAKAIYAPDFERWILRNGLDCVLFNEQHWMPPVLWARSLGVKTGTYVDYYTLGNLSSFEWFDFLICNTRRHTSAFQWHPAVYYVPWGTDVNAFKPGVRPDRPLTFVHSAGWDPERKGTDQVLRAWAQLKSGTHLVVHSQADIQPLLRDPDLRHRIALGELTVLSGTMPPEFIYHLGDVYVYPTHLEGIGLTVAEALASGLPVIVPDDGPMTEFIHDPFSVKVPVSDRCHREDGYYWPSNSVMDADLAEALGLFASQPINEVGKWRAQVRSVAVEKLDWNRNAASLASVIASAAVRVPNPAITRLGRPVHPRLGRAASHLGSVAASLLGARRVRKVGTPVN